MCAEKFVKHSSESLLKPSYVIELLNKLIKNFERFNDFTKILNHLQLFDDTFNLETVPEEYQSEVILLRNNQNLVNAYHFCPILEFYRQLPSDFPKLKQNALRITSYSATTYSFSQLFSHLNLIKN